MINDSNPWRLLLYKRRESLLKRKLQRRWPDTSLARVEEDIFFVAYAIRKLIDSNKLSDELEATQIPASSYPPSGRKPDVIRTDDVDRSFKLDQPRGYPKTCFMSSTAQQKCSMPWNSLVDFS